MAGQVLGQDGQALLGEGVAGQAQAEDAQRLLAAVEGGGHVDAQLVVGEGLQLGGREARVGADEQGPAGVVHHGARHQAGAALDPAVHAPGAGLRAQPVLRRHRIDVQRLGRRRVHAMQDEAGVGQVLGVGLAVGAQGVVDEPLGAHAGDQVDARGQVLDHRVVELLDLRVADALDRQTVELRAEAVGIQGQGPVGEARRGTAAQEGAAAAGHVQGRDVDQRLQATGQLRQRAVHRQQLGVQARGEHVGAARTAAARVAAGEQGGGVAERVLEAGAQIGQDAGVELARVLVHEHLGHLRGDHQHVRMAGVDVGDEIAPALEHGVAVGLHRDARQRDVRQLRAQVLHQAAPPGHVDLAGAQVEHRRGLAVTAQVVGMHVVDQAAAAAPGHRLDQGVEHAVEGAVLGMARRPLRLGGRPAPHPLAPGHGVDALREGAVEIVLVAGVVADQDDGQGAHQVGGMGVLLVPALLVGQQAAGGEVVPQAVPVMDGGADAGGPGVHAQRDGAVLAGGAEGVPAADQVQQDLLRTRAHPRSPCGRRACAGWTARARRPPTPPSRSPGSAGGPG